MQDRAIQSRTVAVPALAWPEDTDVESQDFVDFRGQVARHHVVLFHGFTPETMSALTGLIEQYPLLMIADQPEAIGYGSMFAFGIDRGKVVFHASRSVLESAQVTVRFQLLRLADVHD